MYFFWITSFTSYSCGQKISRISSFCMVSNCECKGHTLLQLLQRVFCRMLTIILMAKKKTETKIPHDCSNLGEIYVSVLLNTCQ